MSDAMHVTGVVSAQEARVNDGGLIAAMGPTALDVRTGALWAPGSTALVTGTSATAPMTVSIAAHHWVTSRGSANGPYRGALESSTTVNIAAAPGSGTRIDVVYVKQQDSTVGVPSPDGTIAPLYGVLQGTVGAGKPSLSAIVGAEELATVSVSAGATSTNGANVTITNTARQTVARGAPIPVRNTTERDAITKTLPTVVTRLDVAGYPEERWDGTRWKRPGVGTFLFSGAVRAEQLIVAEGTGSGAFGGASFVQVGINYAAAGFTVAPMVFAVPDDAGSNGPITVHTSARTTTTAVVVLRTAGGGNSSATSAFTWLAIGY